MKILVTGANGFIGRALCQHLMSIGHKVIPIVRNTSDIPNAQQIDTNDPADWDSVLAGSDTVIHLAGRAHVMREQDADPMTAFRTANVDMTKLLATRAAAHGVARFVFMSTVKVNGERTNIGQRFSPDDAPMPTDPYALSKWEAEQELRKIADNTHLEIVVIRPPLVYGPAAKGNFNTLVNWIKKGIPLPFGAVHDNRRSMIALDNLLSFTSLCADRQQSPSASNQTFLVSDGEAYSTASLLRQIANAYHCNTRLLPVPTSFLRCLLILAGKRAIAERLLDSLEVDDSKANKMLGWHAPITMSEQLRKMANATHS